MIWSIPIGWMNSLTQYALIALGLQRLITRAFAFAVAFNIIANLIFIPRYGFQAAAIATIASELVLFLPFIYLLRRQLADFRILAVLWRPLVALAAMLAAIALLGQSLLALAASGLIYVTVLLLLRPLSAEEGTALKSLLPEAMRGMPALRWIAGYAH